MLVTTDPSTHPHPGCWVWGKKLEPFKVIKRGIVKGDPMFLVEGRERPIHHSMIIGWCEDKLQLMWDAASIEDARQLLELAGDDLDAVQIFSLMLPPWHPYSYYGYDRMPPPIKLMPDLTLPVYGDTATLCGYHLHEEQLFGIYRNILPAEQAIYAQRTYTYWLLDREVEYAQAA